MILCWLQQESPLLWGYTQFRKHLWHSVGCWVSVDSPEFEELIECRQMDSPPIFLRSRSSEGATDPPQFFRMFFCCSYTAVAASVFVRKWRVLESTSFQSSFCRLLFWSIKLVRDVQNYLSIYALHLIIAIVSHWLMFWCSSVCYGQILSRTLQRLVYVATVYYSCEWDEHSLCDTVAPSLAVVFCVARKKCVATDDQMGELKGDPEKCCCSKKKQTRAFLIEMHPARVRLERFMFDSTICQNRIIFQM